MIWPCCTYQDELCDGFAALSRWIYRTLRYSHQKSFSIREETITETILMELIQRYPHRIKVNKFTQADENKTGADWDWLFVGRSKVFRMRIQAKKLYDDKKYGALSSPQQTSKLISSASATKPIRFAAYCFYNYWTGTPGLGGPYCGMTIPAEVIKGCTIASATAVQSITKKPKNSLNNIADISIPWICLVCCPDFRDLDVQSNNDWLPDNVKAICAKLANSKEEVPECEEIDTAYMHQIFSREGKVDQDENLAGVVAFFQEDQTERLYE